MSTISFSVGIATDGKISAVAVIIDRGDGGALTRMQLSSSQARQFGRQMIEIADLLAESLIETEGHA